MTEIKLTKRYPQSRTEDIADAYMRGWNDALDAVQNGKFIINDDRKTENNSEKPNNCEPQTEPLHTCSVNGRPYSECSSCEHFKCTADEPQTDCAWAKPLPEFNCKECKWWSPITKTCHYDGFPCKYEPIPII